MIKKQPLLPSRIRRLPKEGWSWIDRRFLREFADDLNREAILLYFFLTGVSDKWGLSYYSDLAIGSRLRLEKSVIVNARDALIAHDLIAYQSPNYQVLSLPQRQASLGSAGNSEPRLLGDILREIAARDSTSSNPPSQTGEPR